MKAGNKVTYDKLKKDIVYIIIFEPLFIFVFGFKSDLVIPLCVTVFTFLLIPDVIQCIDLSAALKSVITIGLSSLGILAYIFNKESKNTIVGVTALEEDENEESTNCIFGCDYGCRLYTDCGCVRT